MTQIVGWPVVTAVVANDFEGLIQFYADAFGISTFGADETWAGFDLGWPAMFEVLRRDPEGLPPYARAGYRIGFSTGDIHRTVATLLARGQPKPDEIRTGAHGDAWCYFTDPDGEFYIVVQRGGPPERSPGRATIGAPNWIGRVTKDLPRAARFVTGVLGFRYLDSGETWTWFDGGWPNLLETLARDESARQYDAERWQAGFAVTDISKARDELIARGAKPLTDVLGDAESAGYWAYFEDPEANVFEISQRLGPPWPGVARP